MRNDDQKSRGAARSNSFIPSLRTISRIVSSGASNVASTVRSAASAIVERDPDALDNQVFWAGFDKLECEGDSTRRILLLCYGLGFQIWDVEEATNVHEITSRYDIRVSFMQVLPKPLQWKQFDDNFSNCRPLLVTVSADVSSSGGGDMQHGITNMSLQDYSEPHNTGFVFTSVHFYPWKSKSYVHELKFRSAVYSVRCSSRIVAVLLAAEIHCFCAATLEREYNILTNRITTNPGSVTIGLGPLAVGPRWIAYSGPPVSVSGSGRVNPQHLTQSASFSNTSELVTHYAKESTKHFAAGIATIGDMANKKLARYYSDFLPDAYNRDRAAKNHPADLLPDTDNIGMVVVRDLVSKSVITQFRAHKSPILSLCFDPSGTLLVTASNHGNNINVFRIMPTCIDPASSYEQVYSLQRGYTTAVIQDISFSNDSNWIVISTTRTSHLFGKLGIQRNQSTHLPVALSAVHRIRSCDGTMKGSVTGMVAAAPGMAAAATGNTSLFTSAIASTFLSCMNREFGEYNFLVFCHPGCVTEHTIRDLHSGILVKPTRSWEIVPKQSRIHCAEINADIYGENGNNMNQDCGKIFPEVGARVSETDKTHQKFLFEAELEMHEPRVPLWGKRGISFQRMIKENIEIDEENALSGEIEIEEVPSRAIQGRSKDLVPVHGYYQGPQPRVTRDGNDILLTPRQRQSLPESLRFSRRSSNASVDSMTDGGVTHSKTHDSGESSHGKTVNRNDKRVKTVNSDIRGGTQVPQSMSVDSNIGSEMEEEGEDEEAD